MAHEVTDPQSAYLLSAYDYGTVIDNDGFHMMICILSSKLPAVGQLTDDNGNGYIESEDTPDIAVLTGSLTNNTGVFYD